jgi:hypothetical protein
MNLYTPLRHPGAVRLLILHPGQESQRISCSLTKHSPCIWGSEDTLELEQSYEVLEYYWWEDNDHEVVALITLNDEEYEIDVSLRSALYALRLEFEPRYLWIDRICVGWSDPAEARRQELLRMHIYKNAKRVMLWIGADEEDSDLLSFYLRRGTKASTKAAFNLATALAQSSRHEAEMLIKETTPQLIKPRWCYLANLFYRPWFRLSNIMRKNFVDQLNEFEALCGILVNSALCSRSDKGSFATALDLSRASISRCVRGHTG